MKKALVLALVEGIPENLEAIYSRLKLEECAYVLACDLKCINEELGLSVSFSIFSVFLSTTKWIYKWPLLHQIRSIQVNYS